MECVHEEGEFISNIFSRAKSNGKIRIILNLKPLNKFMVYEHFKMEHIDYVTELIHSNDWFGSIDLSDAYFSVAIHHTHWKYLKFTWNSKLYCYKVMVFGLSIAPRIFTRICKPILARLRGIHLIRCSLYIDDMIIMGNSRAAASHNLSIAQSLFTNLGFTVNLEKSVLEPTHRIVHLGFLIDSISLNISLPDNKCLALETKCNALCKKPGRVKIRDVASLVGSFVAATPATKWGKLFYRDLERDKGLAVKTAKGNFDNNMSLSPQAILNIQWWLSNEKKISYFFGHFPFDLHIHSDASSLGWGGHCYDIATGGRWDQSDTAYHINWLELKACWLSVMSFAKDKADIHISVKLDNTCAISYINNMGGIISSLDALAKAFWLWCKARKLWITASFIPGCDNVLADKKSRVFKDNTEWSLNSTAFELIVSNFGTPDVDLFASSLNFKVAKFISWQADPLSFWTDAFTIDWGNLGLCFAFPPFNLVGKVLAKARNEGAELLLVVPRWETQHWYPLAMELMLSNKFPNPLVLPCAKDTIFLPFDSTAYHPIWHRLNLVCFRTSGKH